jgi:hypothetical protein
MTDDTPHSPRPSALPALQRQNQNVPVHLERLAETARDYARGAKAAATLRAYAADWRHYTAWCRRRELEPLPPDPQVVGLYLAASASEPPAPGKKPNAVRTIERQALGHRLELRPARPAARPPSCFCTWATPVPR